MNRFELTQEKFINNPFKKGTRLYKTGDLVRWLECGNLEYIGRNDLQVKIRGYRIEIGEVEAAICSYKEIKQAVVITHELKNGIKYLICYYVADKKLDEGEILIFLEGKLPSFMVPSLLICLEKLPLTIGGKLDKKALPDPEFTGNRANYLAPRNDLEIQVCGVWSEVLRIPEEEIGIRDDFFRLGGDSIISIQLVSKLRHRLSLSVSIKDIFSYKTIEKI